MPDAFIFSHYIFYNTLVIINYKTLLRYFTWTIMNFGTFIGLILISKFGTIVNRYWNINTGYQCDYYLYHRKYHCIRYSPVENIAATSITNNLNILKYS